MAEDDFIIENEERTGGAGRTFLILAGSLLGIFILAAACSLIFLFSNRNTSNPEATAIAATNAVILITNEAVTAAIEATNLAMAQPSDTPEATPTATVTQTSEPATATPTGTAVPTDEPVKESPTPNVSGTTAFTTVEAGEGDGTGDDDATATSASGTIVEAGTATALPAATSTATTSLPDTGGFTTWGPILAALLLIGLLVAARSLRRA